MIRTRVAMQGPDRWQPRRVCQPRAREGHRRAFGKCLKGVHPVSIRLVISARGRAEWPVEIDAIAVIPDAAP
jgi:hypothetical protein